MQDQLLKNRVFQLSALSMKGVLNLSMNSPSLRGSEHFRRQTGVLRYAFAYKLSNFISIKACWLSPSGGFQKEVYQKGG